MKNKVRKNQEKDCVKCIIVWKMETIIKAFGMMAKYTINFIEMPLIILYSASNRKSELSGGKFPL